MGDQLERSGEPLRRRSGKGSTRRSDNGELSVEASVPIHISAEEILFLDYDYPPASVYPSGVVGPDDIRDVDPTSAPPEIRLGTGETLFVHASARDDLRRFCKRHEVPLRRRPDIWAAFLEPFLDTEFGTEDEQRTGELLVSFGLSVEEIDAIRQRFAPAMRAYNLDSGLWDWVHLGLADLLDALLGRLAGEEHKLTAEEFTATYTWAMTLADRSADVSQAIDNSSS